LINVIKNPFRNKHSIIFDQVTFISILSEIKSVINKDYCFLLLFKKMVLIGLLYESFLKNLSNFPNHVIRVSKKDVLNIRSIHFEYAFSGVDLVNNSTTIDLSKLVRLGNISTQYLYLKNISYLILILELDTRILN
jgi:hypothetical protein